MRVKKYTFSKNNKYEVYFEDYASIEQFLIEQGALALKDGKKGAYNASRGMNAYNYFGYVAEVITFQKNSKGSNEDAYRFIVTRYIAWTYT